LGYDPVVTQNNVGWGGHLNSAGFFFVPYDTASTLNRDSRETGVLRGADKAKVALKIRPALND